LRLDGNRNPGVETVPLDQEDPNPSALARIAEKEDEMRVWKAVGDLPTESRTLVVLRHVEGLSYEEIVQITGLNLGTVKSRLARARHQLQEKLKKR